MNLAQIKTRLNSFAGFDLTDSEATDLVNEARRRFALRSEYPRKRGSIAKTVAGQAAYDWPSDLLLVKWLSVAGTPWGASDAESAERFANGELVLEREGVWYDGPSEAGVDQLNLCPTPTADGLQIVGEWIYRPTPLVESSDEPTELPQEFHAALLYEVAATYHETVEDNPELAERNSEKADQEVVALRRHRSLRRLGSGVFKVPILGVDA